MISMQISFLSVLRADQQTGPLWLIQLPLLLGHVTIADRFRKVVAANSYGNNNNNNNAYSAVATPYYGPVAYADPFYNPHHRRHHGRRGRHGRHGRHHHSDSSDSDSSSGSYEDDYYYYLPSSYNRPAYGEHAQDAPVNYGAPSNDVPASSAYGSPSNDSPATSYGTANTFGGK
uniref:Uncharacterized protein n=1 Tax=Caenorhabditis japonica TaxID=281687 RepID=A0A8R1DSA0_CAEJA